MSKVAIDLPGTIFVGLGEGIAGNFAAQTGVMMIIYLDAEHDRWKSEGKLRSLEDLKELIIEGAVKRVRPKMMTVMSTTMGLLPLMWSIGTGADMMKRIAAPMIGGLITSTVLTLVIIPVVYLIWKGRGLEVNNNNKKV